MDQAEIEEAVKELETRVDRLRSLYEQYFMGIEKLEPGVPKKDVERRVQMLRKEQIRNTALRFRFQMVLQRYNTYQSYWLRICRQIEEGTYKRDVLRAKARLGDDAKKKPGKAAAVSSFPVDLDEEFSEADFEEEIAAAAAAAPPPPVVRPPVPVRAPAPAPAPPQPAPPLASAAPAGPVARAGFGTPPKATQSKMKMLAVRLKAAAGGAPPAAAPAKPATAPPAAAAQRPPRTPPPPRPAPAPAPAAAPAPAPRAPGDLSDERVRQLYSQYVDTKRKQNESTASITYDNLAKSLRESSAKLKEKHAGKNVDFEVTVKDGKTILKPIVKESAKK